MSSVRVVDKAIEKEAANLLPASTTMEPLRSEQMVRSQSVPERVLGNKNEHIIDILSPASSLRGEEDNVLPIPNIKRNISNPVTEKEFESVGGGEAKRWSFKFFQKKSIRNNIDLAYVSIGLTNPQNASDNNNNNAAAASASASTKNRNFIDSRGSSRSTPRNRGGSVDAAPPVPTFYCGICLENAALTDKFILSNCTLQQSHTFCTACMHTYTSVQAGVGTVEFACPGGGGCHGLLSHLEVVNVV